MQSARSDTIKELPRTLPLTSPLSCCSPYKRTTKPLRYFGFDKQRRRRRLSYLSNKTQQNIRLKMHLQLNSINFNRFHSRPATRRPKSVTNLCADRQRTPNAAPRGLAWVMWDEVRSHRGSLCASLSHALSILLLRTHTQCVPCYLFALRGNADKQWGSCTISPSPSRSLSVIAAIKRRFVNADAETSRYPWPKLCGQLANWWFDLPIGVVSQHCATGLHN